MAAAGAPGGGAAGQGGLTPDAASSGAAGQIADASDDSNANCAKLRMIVDMRRAEAAACSPLGVGPNICLTTVLGLCCPVLVEDASSPEAMAFAQAVVDFDDSGCSKDCSTPNCPSALRGRCEQGMCIAP